MVINRKRWAKVRRAFVLLRTHACESERAPIVGVAVVVATTRCAPTGSKLCAHCLPKPNRPLWEARGSQQIELVFVKVSQKAGLLAD